ncbi:hypothetical protein PhCBS80983_g06011 [Powellomyces hirtus]|uniref:CCHC-type domain-containing protein n=1 Tax=Powellomyces hirtus TaxID=109895 RepID=A0A507DR55_9FUNG|nr:hypothetical protein PhCBS80983_g06011 [Powellomyces hirtus]
MSAGLGVNRGGGSRRLSTMLSMSLSICEMRSKASSVTVGSTEELLGSMDNADDVVGSVTVGVIELEVAAGVKEVLEMDSSVAVAVSEEGNKDVAPSAPVVGILEIAAFPGVTELFCDAVVSVVLSDARRWTSRRERIIYNKRHECNECFNCGGKGHYASGCPAGKGKTGEHRTFAAPVEITEESGDVPQPRMQDKIPTDRPGPRIHRRTFVVHGKVQGHFARILIDTGCNTLIISDTWAAKHGLRTYTSPTLLEVQWGDRAGNYRATKMTYGDLSVFTKEKITYREDTVPFVVAPIRVDVILGLPFILGLDMRWLFDQEDFPTMTFYHDGQTLSLRAKPTNRYWEAPSACAACLLSPREVRPRRFQPARPALNVEGIYMAKQWKRLMKKGEITGVFEVHIVDAIPVVEAQFAADQEDPLEALAANHPLRPALEKYVTTLFTEQSGMPPD